MDTLSVTYVIWLFGLGEKKDDVKRRKDKESKELTILARKQDHFWEENQLPGNHRAGEKNINTGNLLNHTKFFVRAYKVTRINR